MDGALQGFGDLGLSIPGSNQITGISVKVDGSASTASGTLAVQLSWDG